MQQAKAQYLGTLSTIPQLEGSLRQNQNALGVLLARPPGPLPEIAGGKNTIPQAELGSSSICPPTCCVAVPTSARSRCSWPRSRRRSV